MGARQACVLRGEPEVSATLVDPLHNFLSMWLSIYQQCSAGAGGCHTFRICGTFPLLRGRKDLDPLNKPKVIVSDKDLKKCRNIPDIAGLVADRLQKDSVTFIKAWITKLRDQDNKVRTAGDIEG